MFTPIAWLQPGQLAMTCQSKSWQARKVIWWGFMGHMFAGCSLARRAGCQRHANRIRVFRNLHGRRKLLTLLERFEALFAAKSLSQFTKGLLLVPSF